MAKLRHIAIATNDPKKTAEFYKSAFGFREVGHAPEAGAKLTVDGSVEGLHLKEFFLLLSSTGLAYRRCELAWVNGDQIGVNFLKQDKKKKTRRTQTAEA